MGKRPLSTVNLDDACFVFGCELNGSGGASDVGMGASKKPTWLHFDYSAGDVERRLIEHGLEPNVAESLVRTDTRPRTVSTADGVLVVLRGVNSNPGAEPEDMVSLRMWIEQNRLITVRQRRLLSVQDVWNSLHSGKGPVDIASLVIAIVERLADRISDFLESIEERISAYEENIETQETSETRSQVNALRRQTAVVRRFLAPQRDALDNLSRQSRGILDEDQTYSIREQSDRITRYVEDLDLVRERALVLQEELLSRSAQEQNARMYVLSIVAAVFLPITFVTGLFGMNVAGLPGTQNAAAFWLVCGVMLATSLGVVVWLRLKRWL